MPRGLAAAFNTSPSGVRSRAQPESLPSDQASPIRNAMAAAGEFGARRLREPGFERQQTRLCGARVERTRHMLGVEGRAVDRLLQVHPVMGMVQEHQGRPLVLLVAAGRAEGEIGFAVLERERRRQCAARAPAGFEARRQPLLEPEHLHPRAEAEAQFGDHRRALQPAAARGRRHHVAPAVDHIDMAGVAGHRAMAADRGFAHPAYRRLADAGAEGGFEPADEQPRRQALGPARSEFERGGSPTRRRRSSL